LCQAGRIWQKLHVIDVDEGCHFQENKVGIGWPNVGVPLKCLWWHTT